MSTRVWDQATRALPRLGVNALGLAARRAVFAISAFLFLAVSFSAASFSQALASSALYAGGYNGLGPASGFAMLLEQDGERVYGRIVDGRANVFQVNGQVLGGGVKGTLSNARAQATFELELRPTGVSFVFTPTSADGRPIPSGQKTFSFARGRVSHPALADYRVTAPKPGDKVDVILFLENYRSWTVGEVATAYAGVAPGDRAVFRLHDHLHADLMLRLCRAQAADALIADISEGQSIGCDKLLSYADRAEAVGVMQDFYDVTEYQRGSAYSAFACDRDLYPPSRCLNVDKLTSYAAANWRPAHTIFEKLTAGNKSVASVMGITDNDAKAQTRRSSAHAAPRRVSDIEPVRPRQRSVAIVPESTRDEDRLIAATEGVSLNLPAALGSAGSEAANRQAPNDTAFDVRPRMKPVRLRTQQLQIAGLPDQTQQVVLPARPRPKPKSVSSSFDIADLPRPVETTEAKSVLASVPRPARRPTDLVFDPFAGEKAASSGLRPRVAPAFDERPRPRPAAQEGELADLPFPRTRPAMNPTLGPVDGS